MARWYMIDDATTDRGQVFEIPLSADTQEEAVEAARNRFGALSRRDRDHRDACYVGRAELDADGCVDYDTMTDIYTIK